ncbi:cation-translocating P-type ATPase [Foetidibacter luteolus]|uniref:cation-translocating P-type ATPase n=1 Tax=Foetidibacter luteolus TaxID=2608880 RepID=UPI001A98B5EC|nr:HAD-IC family P-type ATPase [Foetidibacter luteolus]
MDAIYHQLPVEEVIAQLQTSRQGLSGEEVQKRLQQYGKNSIPQPRSKSLAVIFFQQFLNPLIYVLIAAAAISVATGDVKDAIFITAIIVINAVLGTYQEWRAENSAQALRNMVKVKCRVKRGNHINEIDSEELVPGDIVLLESGFKVPADLRLIEVNELSVEEALLTGESVAVNKNTNPLQGGNELSLGDRLNMVFAATTVQKGRGIGVVTATAQNTQIGRIADSLRTTESEKPPLVRRMESFSKKISIIVLGVCVVLGIIGYLEGMPAGEIFFLMVAVGVSAIPEGLPVALTVALSIGTRRMAKRNVIVRKLPAVEGLGSCTLVASDKTGTLTMDQQSVQKLYLPDGKFYEVTGQGYNGEGDILDGGARITEMNGQMQRFMLASILSNEGILRKTADGWEHSGDAVDVAFRALAYKIGKEPKFFKEQAEVVEMIPYESERKYSAVYFKQDGRLQFAMKGAVEVVLKHLPENEREKVNEVSEQMAAEGFRVLALAGVDVEATGIDKLPPLQLFGLIGMIDPLRPEAKDAVQECQRAGIRVVMVTGDHPATALAIATSLGIAKTKEEIITGTQLSGMEELDVKSLAANIKDKRVFARVAPLQKQRIVEAMKSLGHFVAVTGDGANDAPALKSAHIGVAMGAGTDLAKEASSIIITDNNFASIAAGVEEGRFTFDNLRKIIYLLISTGVAELLAVALAIILNVAQPFLAVQLLWLNLVTNGIQDIALAFEKGDKAVMQKPPRKPDESIFDKLMNSQIIVSGVFIAAAAFGVWYYLINHAGYNEKHARTVVMMLMVLLQNFHVLNCRSETKSLFKLPLKNNYVLLVGIVLAQLVHISAAFIPGLNNTLQLEPITFNEWLVLLPAAAGILLVMEIFKWIWKKSNAGNNQH